MDKEFRRIQKAQTRLLFIACLIKVITWLGLVGGTLLLLRHFGII